MNGKRPLADAVLAAFGLSGSVVAMVPVGGAWSNRVFRLETTVGRFAVKQMCNPWGYDRWREWLDEAWRFERAAIGVGVAAPEPVPSAADGGCLAWVDCVDGAAQVPVRLHRWVDGAAPPAGPVGQGVAEWAGRTLAVLHGLAAEAPDRSIFPPLGAETAERWPELADAARAAGAPWADRLAGVWSAVVTIAELAREAVGRREREVMCHGDVDQKNLILTGTGTVLCDWDVAMPLVPRWELADVALSLGDWADLAVSRCVIRAYAAAGGDTTPIGPADLGPSMLRGLDWVAFNVECVLGQRAATPARAALAGRLLPGLLDRLPVQVTVALRTRESLIP